MENRSNILRLLCWTCVVVIFAAAQPSYSDPTKIGVIISQTGPLAAIGQGVVNGIVLASEQLDRDRTVKFIFEDDGTQAARAVSAAEKLINQDNVSALITFAGASSTALAPMAEKRQLPLLTITAGDRHTVGKKFVYRLFLSTDAQTQLLQEGIGQAGLKRIALATTTQESLLRLREELRRKLGGIVVIDDEVPPNDTDMNALATKILAKRPDGIVLYLMPPQLAQFAKASRVLGYTGSFFGGIQVAHPAQIESSGGALIGTAFPAPAIEKNRVGFFSDYEQRFKEPVTSQQEIYGYEVASLLIAAAHTPSMGTYLESLTFVDGLAGKYPRRANNFFEVPAKIYRIMGPRSVVPVD